ncbi:hypothetical protein D3C72_1045800 [compost metagenome]
MLFAYDKIDRQIALARFAQTPVGQQLQAGKLTGTQLPGVGDIAPGVFRVDHFLTALLCHTAFVERCIQPAGVFSLFHQLAANWQQVKDIGSGVVQLTFSQWTRQPVGARLALIQRNPGILFDHRGKAPGERTAGESGENLRINQGFRHHAKGIEEYLQIFTTRMQIFGHGGIEQKFTHRRPVRDTQRVNQRDFFAIVHLDQTQLGIVGSRANKLGIQSNSGKVAGDVAQRCQLVVGSDHLVIQNGFSLVCAHKKRRLTGVWWRLTRSLGFIVHFGTRFVT